jgi:hypothetical protein
LRPCGNWPERDRWALREMLDTLPLHEPTSIECEVAFWRNMGLPVRDDDATGD